MRRAIALADKPSKSLLPNPRVGAVIVKNSKIIAEGYHRGPGKAHAELAALKKAKVSTKGATLYCSLEPCVHLKKRTPPCVPAIIESGIKRLVVAHLDPNPEVSGKGLKALRKAGIEVKTNCLSKEAMDINQAFIKNQVHELPYIILKVAMSFDGKMADDFGKSQWITSERSRKRVHQERLKAQTIGVGKGTIECDDPRLSIRLNSKEVFSPLIIFGKPKNLEGSKAKKIRHSDQVHLIDSKDWQTSLQNLYQHQKISEIYVEGGPRLASEILRLGLVDRLIVYYGRGFIGGHAEHSIGRLWELKTLEKSVSFQPREAEILGPDLRTSGDINVYRIN